MPTPQHIASLQALLDTRTPITLIETHDEPRVPALQRQRRRDAAKDAIGSRATLDSLLRHMVGLPQPPCAISRARCSVTAKSTPPTWRACWR